jgi:hypothetical protein|tara:strand:- start:55 stop:486 length:432 start_codon:yes stop_codon:yes gene_type:complete
MHHEKKVVWEKWSDPYAAEDTHYKFEDLELKSTEEVAEFEELEEEFKDADVNDIEQQMFQFLITDNGAVPINNNHSIDKIFNFWTGHTNFSITPKIAKEIELVEGVEVLDVITRYRFRVGVGKLFKGNEVMSSVQRTIKNYVE